MIRLLVINALDLPSVSALLTGVPGCGLTQKADVIKEMSLLWGGECSKPVDLSAGWGPVLIFSKEDVPCQIYASGRSRGAIVVKFPVTAVRNGEGTATPHVNEGH